MRGKSLVAKDWSLLPSRRRSDPYAVVFVDGVEAGRTEVARKTLHPEWGAAFDVAVAGDAAAIELRLVDRDFGSKDEAMGVVTLAVSRERRADERWRKVERCAGCKNAKGEVLCSAYFREAVVDDDDDVAEDARWTLRVIRARRLAARDAGGTSDPFCVVELESEGGYVAASPSPAFWRVGVTPVRWKTLDPTWDHAVDFDAPFPRGAGGGEDDPTSLDALATRGPVVRLRLFDKDTFSADDALGSSYVALGALPRDGTPTWVAVTSGAAQIPKDCGVLVSATFAARPPLRVVALSANCGNAPLAPLSEFLGAAEGADVAVVGLQESTFHSAAFMPDEAAADALTPRKAPRGARDSAEADGGPAALLCHTLSHDTPVTPPEVMKKSPTPTDDYKRRVAAALPHFDVVANGMRGQMRLLVLVRRPLAGGVSELRNGGENTGLGHVVNNKGGMLFSLRLAGASHATFCFYNAHLAAHEGKADRRNSDVADQGRKEVIQRRFDVGVLEATLERKASTR